MWCRDHLALCRLQSAQGVGLSCDVGDLPTYLIRRNPGARSRARVLQMRRCVVGISITLAQFDYLAHGVMLRAKGSRTPPLFSNVFGTLDFKAVVGKRNAR